MYNIYIYTEHGKADLETTINDVEEFYRKLSAAGPDGAFTLTDEAGIMHIIYNSSVARISIKEIKEAR